MGRIREYSQPMIRALAMMEEAPLQLVTVKEHAVYVRPADIAQRVTAQRVYPDTIAALKRRGAVNVTEGRRGRAEITAIGRELRK